MTTPNVIMAKTMPIYVSIPFFFLNAVNGHNDAFNEKMMPKIINHMQIKAPFTDIIVV